MLIWIWMWRPLPRLQPTPRFHAPSRPACERKSAHEHARWPGWQQRRRWQPQREGVLSRAQARQRQPISQQLLDVCDRFSNLDGEGTVPTIPANPITCSALILQRPKLWLSLFPPKARSLCSLNQNMVIMAALRLLV